jgi:hypothetical protein
MNTTTITNRLTDLRRVLEIETGHINQFQACLLTDVCRALDLDEQQTELVVGPAYQPAICQPCLRSLNIVPVGAQTPGV